MRGEGQIMKNVYDIKQEKGLNFIIPLQQKIETDIHPFETNKVLVVMHLHYIDTIENYFTYIKAIPKRVDLIITVSDGNVREALEKIPGCPKGRYKIVEKENRGRDISAFLVACREEILRYDYVCFLHDKKEKDKVLREDIRKWVMGLWDNMAGSDIYIHNIMDLFHRNPRLGLLVPPFPISDRLAFFYTDHWEKNFELTKKLAEKMNLNTEIDAEKPPLALGTVFWAKVPALRKLFEIEWTYKDFDEEPLKDDGTISHAIERILPFVAQDAGYDTGWVMTDKYAGEQSMYMQNVLKKSFLKLKKYLDIWYIAELDGYEERLEQLLGFVNRYERFYIYGAGILGKKYYRLLKRMKKKPEAFLVSDKGQNEGEIEGIPVRELSEAEIDERTGIVIGMSERYQQEVIDMIRKERPSFDNLYLHQRI